MKHTRKSKSVVLWYCRLSFPHVFEPQAVMQDGKEKGPPRYSAQLILTDKSVAKIRRIEKELIRDAWPEGLPEGVAAPTCLRSGDLARKKDPNYRGKMFVSANARPDSPPKFLRKDSSGAQYEPPEDEAREMVYSGAEMHVHVGIYTTQMSALAPQINVGLNFLTPDPGCRHLSRFDGRPDAATAFASAEDEMDEAPELDESEIQAPEAPPTGEDTEWVEEGEDEDLGF